MRVREIKIEAKERFAVNRYQAMLIYGVVYTLALNIAVLTTVLWIVNKWAVWYGVLLIFLFLLMLAPFAFGMTGFYLKLYKFEACSPSLVFEGFNKHNLERVIVLRLLKFALWLAFTILLIVPGIIFAIRTSMATYILRANPKLRPVDALRASNRIMKSHCMLYLALILSFVGWFFMGIVTCGLGFIWVLPYENVAKIVFYKRELQGDKTVYRNPRDQKPVEIKKTESQQPVIASEEKERRFFSEDRIEVETLDDFAPVTEEEKRKFGITDSVIHRELTSEEREREDRFFYGEDKIEVEEYDESIVAESPLIDKTEEEIPDTQYVSEATGQNKTDDEIESAQGSEQDGASNTDELLLSEAEASPLPGGSVIVTDNGTRVVTRPLAGKALPDVGNDNVEINEQGESIQQRLVRLRAERAAKAGQKDGLQTKKNNVEIGED